VHPSSLQPQRKHTKIELHHKQHRLNVDHSEDDVAAQAKHQRQRTPVGWYISNQLICSAGHILEADEEEKRISGKEDKHTSRMVREVTSVPLGTLGPLVT
jgi:hypothetical protein